MVGKGFYRGSRTGSLGAHTTKGGYLIDYRKVRAYNVPDLKDFSLTPFVTHEIGEKESPKQPAYPEDATDSVNHHFRLQDDGVIRRERAMEYIQNWKIANPGEFDRYENQQIPDLHDAIARAKDGEQLEVLEKLRIAIRRSRDAEASTYGNRD